MKSLLSLALSLLSVAAAAADPAPRALAMVNYRGEQLPVFALPRPIFPKKSTAPRYPRQELAAAIDGSATVTMLVDTQGRVVEVDVLHSEPTAAFGEAASAAVRHWRFEPQLQGGQPTKFIVQQTVSFRAPTLRTRDGGPRGPSMNAMMDRDRFPYVEGFGRMP